MIGPAVRHLEYHEKLVPFFVSIGTPKDHKRQQPQVYLRIQGNSVSDEIIVMTSNYVSLRVRITYLINFDHEHSTKWWSAGNYVKVLTEVMSDRILAAVRGLTLHDFYGDPSTCIVNAVLGEAGEYVFEDYGFAVSGVKVVSVDIEDNELARQVSQAQRTIVQSTLTLNNAEQELELTRALEEVKREIARLQAETENTLHKLALKNVARNVELAEVQQEHENAKQEAAQALLDLIATAKRARELADAESRQQISRAKADLERSMLEAQTQAVVDRYGAMSGQELEVLRRVADEALMANLTQNMAGSAQLAGQPVLEYVRALLDGTGMERLANFFARPLVNPMDDEE